MTGQLIPVLDAAASGIDVAVRHGEAIIIAGSPHVHTGGGELVPVVNDLSGTWSYWRTIGTPSAQRADIGEACIGVRLSMQLRHVMWVERDGCSPALIGVVNSIRAAGKAMATATGAASVQVDRVTWGFDSVWSQEFQPVPVWPPHKMLVNVDVSLVIEASEQCLASCSDTVSVLCRLMDAASIEAIRECLGDRIDQLCEEVICNPLTVTINGEEVRVVEDPCGDTVGIEVVCSQDGEPVGEVGEDGKWVVDCAVSCPIDIEVRNTLGVLVDSDTIPDACDQEGPVVLTAPDAIVTLNGGPFGTVPSGGTIDVPCIPDPCDPLVIQFDGFELLSESDPCGKTVLLDCSTNGPVAFLSGTNIESGLDIKYVWDGTKFVNSAGFYFGNTGSYWEIYDSSSTILYYEFLPSAQWPWDVVSWIAASGSGTDILVTQGSIGDYCCCDPIININGVSVPVVATEGCLYDIQCDTLTMAAWVIADGHAHGGLFVPTGGTINGRPDYVKVDDPERIIYYDGTQWVLEKTGGGAHTHFAEAGNEDYPWQADWSKDPDVTVVQAQVSQLCDAECQEAEYTLKDTAGNILGTGIIPSGGSSDIVAPDATVQLKDTSAINIGSAVSYLSGSTNNLTAPDATVRTTDGLTTVQTIRSNANGNLPQSVIKYKDAANADQTLTASNTEFSGGTLRPATQIPRRQILNTASNPANITYATAADLVNNTLPVAQDATVQLKDSAANNIGSPVSYPSNTSNNLTAPDGSVQLKNSAGTNIGSAVAVRSNQTGVVVTAPDATIQRKDSAGNVIGLPLAALSNITTDVTCPDGTVQLRDTASGAIGSPVAVRSNQTGVTVTAPDATVQLRDSAANNIGSPVAYLSNSSNNLTAPDGSVQLKDTAGTNIGSPVAVRSNQTGVVVTAPDANVEVNGTAFDTVLSNGTIDVPVVNTAAVAVGAVTAGVDVEIADSIIEVNGTPETTVPAEDTLDVQIVDDTNTPVTPVAVTTPSAGVLKIEVPAGAPPAAPTTGTFLTGGRMNITPGDFITQPEVDAFLVSDQWTKIAVGDQHIVAIKNGELWVYGSNNQRAIGQATINIFYPLTRIGSDSDWTDCAAGLACSYAIRAGRLYVVGLNTSGVLGNGSTTAVNTWTQIGSDTDWSRVEASRSQNFAVAIKANHIYTCGSNSTFQTGLNTSVGNTTSWTLADNSQTFTDISAGGSIGAAVGGGRLFTWGTNSSGRTAQGTSSGSTQVPTQVGSDTDWSKVACGNTHMLAIKTTGTMWASGAGTNGRLGTGNSTQQTSMTASGADSDWAEVSLYDGTTNGAGASSYARKTNGTVWGCGANAFGQIGQATIAVINSSWLQMGTASNHSHIVAGRGFCLTVRT